MRILLLLLIVTPLVLNTSVHSSKQSSESTFYAHLNPLFDEDLSDSLFLGALKKFNNYVNLTPLTTKKEHSGQTYYTENTYANDLSSVSSITYFNSMTPTMLVRQLLYKKDIIHVSVQGGKDYELSEHKMNKEDLKDGKSTKGYGKETYYHPQRKIGLTLIYKTVPRPFDKEEFKPIAPHPIEVVSRTYFPINETNTPHIFIERH